MKKHKFVSFALLSFLLLTIIGNFLAYNGFKIPAVQASPDTLPSDGDAWTENNNATYPWTTVYAGNTLSWTTTGAKNGTYALNATHTTSETRMYLELTLPSYINVSTYEYVYFWYNVDDTASATFYIYDSVWGTGKSHSAALAAPRLQWDLYIIRLKSFSESGTADWGEKNKFRIYWNGLTANGNETLLIDGLHFTNYDQSGASSSIDELLLAQVSHYMHSMSWPPAGAYPESLYAMKNITDGTRSNGLETESLGQSIFMYCMAYNITGYDYYLDMANTWANALYAYQNDTVGTDGYGGFAYGRSAGEQRTLVNAWILVGISHLYHHTQNTTVKTMCDRSKQWLADFMWDAANHWFDHSYVPSTDTKTESGSLDWGRCGVSAGALAAYSAYVQSNSTLTGIADDVLNQIIAVSSYKIFYHVSMTETTSYGYWGLYHGYVATDNATYRDAFLNSTHRFMLANLKNQQHNGSITYSTGYHRADDESDGGLSGWGHMIGLMQIVKAYEYTLDGNFSNLLSKMLWDYIPQIVFTENHNDGAITFYYNSAGAYAWGSVESYTPTSACVVAAIQWYYQNVATPHATTYVIDASEQITSITHSAADLRFTVNATAGKTSTTRIYSSLTPTNVYGATTHSYNSTSKILTVTRLHSSADEIIVELPYVFYVHVLDITTSNPIEDVSIYWTTAETTSATELTNSTGYVEMESRGEITIYGSASNYSSNSTTENINTGSITVTLYMTAGLYDPWFDTRIYMGVTVAVATGATLIYWYRRKKKTRTVNV